MVAFTIPGSPATKKTSNQIVGKKRRFVMPSKTHQQWFKGALVHALQAKLHHVLGGQKFPLTGPLHVKALFYRGDHRRVDLSNLVEALADLLQKVRIIDDDYSVESWDGSRRLYDDVRPRIDVEITPLSTEGWSG